MVNLFVEVMNKSSFPQHFRYPGDEEWWASIPIATHKVFIWLRFRLGCDYKQKYLCVSWEANLISTVAKILAEKKWYESEVLEVLVATLL
jgi:hypothetical protein